MRFKSLLLAATGLCALWAGQALAETPAPSNTVSELVVTGTPYPVSLNSMTTSVDIVTAEKLETSPPVGLGDLLEGLPGLRSTFYGPGASRPVIRGLSGPRVLILQNGVGLVDASTLSPDHAVASEPSEASRIEVLRGPATLAYGGSAIGGVVNIIDDRVPSTPAQGGVDGRIAGSLGSGDDSYAISGALKVGSGPWVLAIDGVKRESDDYDIPGNAYSSRLAAQTGATPLPGRTQLNTDVHLEAYGLGLSYIGDDGYIGASVKRTTTQYGIPVEQIVPMGPPGEGPVYIDLQQTRYDFRGEKSVDWGPFDKARFSIGYADYKHAEVSVDTGDIGTTFLSKGTEGRVELVQTERDGWKGAFGFQGLTRRFNAIGDEAFVPKVDINEMGVFTLQRLDRDKWGVEGGLRIDRRTLSADLLARPTSDAAASYGINWATARRDPEFDNVSASVSVFFRPADDWFLGLSLSRNRRAPTEFELFADGPHPGTGAYEIGDPRLGTETATSLEGTARWTTDRAKLELHVYAARYSGFIEEIRTGDRVDEDGTLNPAGELPVSLFTQSDAKFVGGELEGSYRLWGEDERSLSLEGAFDYVRGTTDSGPAARIPPYSVLGRLIWSGPRLDGELELRHVGEQDRVTPFELPTDAYDTVNAKLSYKLFADQDIKLFIDGRNLTDQLAREHTSFLKDIAPLPGRTIRIGFTANF
jgi:iron complex outermembrane receptor protein